MPKSPENPSASARVTRRAALGSAAAAAAVRVVPARAAATTGRPAAAPARLLSAWAWDASWDANGSPWLIAPDPDSSVWTLGGGSIVHHAHDGTWLADWPCQCERNDHGFAHALMVGPDGTIRISLGWEFENIHFSRTGELVGRSGPRRPQTAPSLPLSTTAIPREPQPQVTGERDGLPSPDPLEAVVYFDDFDHPGDLDAVTALRLPPTIIPVYDLEFRVIDWTIPWFDLYETVLAPDGSCWVHGGEGQICHVSADGDLLAFWWAYRNDRRLTDIALSLDGSIWTLHPEYRQVRRFSPAGDLLASWGTYGDAPGQLDDPASLAVAANGSVLVADLGNRRVHHFAPDGTFLGCLGDGDVAAARLVRPATVHASADGTVFVIDHEPHRTLRFALA